MFEGEENEADADIAKASEKAKKAFAGIDYDFIESNL